MQGSPASADQAAFDGALLRLKIYLEAVNEVRTNRRNRLRAAGTLGLLQLKFLKARQRWFTLSGFSSLDEPSRFAYMAFLAVHPEFEAALAAAFSYRSPEQVHASIAIDRYHALLEPHLAHPSPS